MANQEKAQRKLILGITGGIAAYKAAELVRLLIKQNYDVQVVMTKAACEFITPMTMQALSNKPVYTDLWQTDSGNGMQHIEQSRQCDAIIIAPTTADFMAKLANGLADDLLSNLCLARDCPLLIAPAMNQQMWLNPATQRNYRTLVNDGLKVLGPDSGEQACGEVGPGRMLAPEALLDHLDDHFTPKLFANRKLLITAGANLEMIDPVRGITNLSSGKMGFALAKIAAQMGAKVTLVAGVSHEKVPDNVTYLLAKDANSMHETVMDHITQQDIMIGVAAVADYSPISVSSEKIKKTSVTLNLELTKNKDIIADVANLPTPPYCVGFAAETENLIENAEKKRIRKQLPMIVANLVKDSMGLDKAELTVITESNQVTLPTAHKAQQAFQLLELIAKEAL